MRYLFLIILLIGYQRIEAQVYRFRASQSGLFSPKEGSPKPKFEENQSLIVEDDDKKTITVYSTSGESVYAVVNVNERTEEKGDGITHIKTYEAIDPEGVKMQIDRKTSPPKTQAYDEMIFFSYEHIVLVYIVKEMKGRTH